MRILYALFLFFASSLLFVSSSIETDEDGVLVLDDDNFDDAVKVPRSFFIWGLLEILKYLFSYRKIAIYWSNFMRRGVVTANSLLLSKFSGRMLLTVSDNINIFELLTSRNIYSNISS